MFEQRVEDLRIWGFECVASVSGEKIRGKEVID